MRRLVIGIAIVGLSPSLRADSSLPFAPTERSPVGTACDAALANAQRAFARDNGDVKFRLERGTYSGAYYWSDRCGVFGDYEVELRREPGPATRWRHRSSEHSLEEHRRQNGWRATLRTRGSDESPGLDFIETFRPALEACLAAAQPHR